MMSLLLTSAMTRHVRAQHSQAPSTGEAASCDSDASRTGCKPAEVVVVGTRSPESVQRATIKTGVVTRDEAERRGARNVGEALAGESTLQVNPQAYGYLGSPSGVQMQGLDAERVLILEDGERVTGDVGGVVDLAQLPLTDVERIEYVTGPTSSLYGTNALGGVVNVVTAPPRATGASGRLRLEGRDRGDWLGEGSLAYRRDDDWVGGDFSMTHTASEPLGEGPDTLVPRINTRLLGLRGGTTPQRRAQLRFKLRWIHDEALGATSEQVPGLGPYLISLPDVTDRVTARIQETLRISSKAHLDFSLARSWFTAETMRDRANSPADERHSSELDDQSFESVLTLQDGSARTWILGVRGDVEQFSQDFERTELIDGRLQTQTTAEVGRTQLASGALFAQLAWLFGGKLTILPGLRTEVHDRYGSILAPRLAVAYRPREELAFRSAFGRGFRAPSAKEYGFLFDHSAIGYRVLGNPDLEPERSWGVTADASWRPRPWLLLRAGGFGNWVSELIGTDLAPEQDNPAVTDYTYVNVSRARTAGGDASVQLRPSERWALDASYAYLWTRDDSTGKPLPTRPPHTVTLAIVGRPFERLEGSARYRWVSSAYVAEDIRAPGFGTLDLRLDCRIWREMHAYTGVLNLLDTHKDPERLGDTRPVLGRSFYLGVSGNLPGSDELERAAN